VNLARILQPPPPLRRPVLVAAFEGWNDAGEAASGAVTVLARQLGATTFAELDAEELFDFQATRPHVSVEGERRTIQWPENRLAWARPGAGGRDVIILQGTEPNLRWGAFTRSIVDLVQELGVDTVLTLGALQVDVPHTRAVPVSGSATTDLLRRRAAVRVSTYEGPTGITGVLHSACVDAGMEAVSMWAGVPHYLAGTPYVAAALTLVERVGRLLGLELDLDDLARDAAAQRDDIAELVAEDDDLADYVGELETRFDERGDDVDLSARLVSGDELAAELERYLRDRGDS
jgi:proteasome assembly chaperone (PAC2) family protein